MSSPLEREFLERRLKIVEKRLKEVNAYEIDDEGRFHLCYQNVPTKDYALVREESLLTKLLAQVPEGKVSKTLGNWRKVLGKKLHKHREYYRPMQDEYDRWMRLPFPTRIEIPEPPHPPELEILDYQGMVWFVDDVLLSVLDDLKIRLKKWTKYY